MDSGRGRIEAVSESVRYLGLPLSSSTLTTVLAFHPVLLLDGAIGEFINTISLGVILALGASLAISLTTIAVLAGITHSRVSRDRPRRWWRNGLSSSWLAARHRSLLGAAPAHPRLSVIVLAALPAIEFLISNRLGSQFFPYSDRDQFQVKVWLPEDATIRHTEDRAPTADSVIRKMVGVEEVHCLIGASMPHVY